MAFEIQNIGFSLRFLRGYRYLDRCGEAIIRLEDVLENGWIPAETLPSSGTMRNDELGLVARFNAEGLQVQQHDVFSFDTFRDQSCKVFDVLRSVLELKRINVPAMQTTYQRGFENVDDAESELQRLQLAEPTSKSLELLGGSRSAFSAVLCTDQEFVWRDCPTIQRRRLNASTIAQLRQLPFDERLLKRARLLPQKQREAMQALMRIRANWPHGKPYATQIELENSLESEFDAKTFDLPQFLLDSWNWAETCRKQLSR
jgi:hypothetical protein